MADRTSEVAGLGSWPDVEGGYLPTPGQSLLLRAALAAGEHAGDAFRTWADAGGMAHLDEGSFRLLPLVYRNLQTHGIVHPLLPTLRGIHRRSWCKNQLLWSELPPILERFREAGIPTMVLKGQALAVAYYKDAGARPMRDLDIAVPEARAEQALTMLARDGWTPMSWMAPAFTREFRGARHAVALRNGAGRELDLHWHVLWQCCAPRADDAFWARASTLDIGGVPTLVLDPTDQLLHACAHGLMWNEIPPVRWIADAVMIARSAEIDWRRLVADLQSRRLTLLGRTGLQYLQDRFALPVPSSALDALRRAPVTRGEAMDFVRVTEPQRLLRPADTVRAVWHQYGRSATGGPWSRAVGFVRYQQYQWFEPTLASAWGSALRWASRRALGARGAPREALGEPAGGVVK